MQLALPVPRRRIAHIDMDAFYAEVERRERPWLGDRPLIVARRLNGHGVVTAVDYQGRDHGVRSGMPILQAEALCRWALVVEPRMSLYKEVSKEVFSIFEQVADVVEPLAFDEAWLDLTGRCTTLEEAEASTARARQRVVGATGLTCSAGVSYGKHLAKMASKCRKPDGQLLVTEQTAISFLDSRPLQALFGLGPAGLQRLEHMGISDIPGLRACALDRLVEALGPRTARRLYDLVRGVDLEAVRPPKRPSPSSSRETDRPQAGSSQPGLFALASESTEEEA